MNCRRAVRGSGSCRSTSYESSVLSRSSTSPTGTRTPVLPAVRRASFSSGLATVVATAGPVSPPRQPLSPAWGPRSRRLPEALQVSHGRVEWAFLGAFAKLLCKATFSCVMCVCACVRARACACACVCVQSSAWNNSTSTGRIFMKFDI